MIIFTAGTGILVYLDLIAHLIRKQLRCLSKFEEHQIPKDFKLNLILYYSFHGKDESIGLEMLQGLEEIAQDSDLFTFKLILRDGSSKKR